MERVRVLIVDDEPLAREGLRSELALDPEVSIIAECAEGQSAVSSIKRLLPDIVFLDVQMPVLDGFGVIEAIGAESMPIVIFITAYDEHAARAFESYALDYILKPVNAKRLHASLARAKKHLLLSKKAGFDQHLSELIKLVRAERQTSKPSGYLERIPVKVDERVIFLKAADISWVESEDNYVRLHCKSEAHLLRETLSKLADKLDPTKFLRIRRSTLVNIDRIQELRPLFNSEYIVLLEDGTRLQSSRRFRKNLDTLLRT